MDKRAVSLIASFHSNDMEAKMNKCGYEEIKPVLVYDYNKNMGGVNKRDQMLHGFLVERKKDHKWYTKLFKRLLNISLLNSYIISKCHN